MAVFGLPVFSWTKLLAMFSSLISLLHCRKSRQWSGLKILRCTLPFWAHGGFCPWPLNMSSTIFQLHVLRACVNHGPPWDRGMSRENSWFSRMCGPGKGVGSGMAIPVGKGKWHACHGRRVWNCGLEFGEAREGLIAFIKVGHRC